MIISNFAALHLKGEGNWFACHVQALAQHYQIFEELPVEKQGESQNARSWLYDENV